MMNLKLKRRKGPFLRKLKAIKKLDSQKVEVGHFKGEVHSTADMSYVELMQIHHVGRPGSFPPRPVLDVLKFRNRDLLGQGEIKRAMKKWVRGDMKPEDTKELLNTYGRYLRNSEKAIFGKPLALSANAPSTVIKKGGRNTPLVDTSELKDNVGFRTSLNKAIKKSGI